VASQFVCGVTFFAFVSCPLLYGVIFSLLWLMFTLVFGSGVVEICSVFVSIWVDCASDFIF